MEWWMGDPTSLPLRHAPGLGHYQEDLQRQSSGCGTRLPERSGTPLDWGIIRLYRASGTLHACHVLAAGRHRLQGFFSRRSQKGIAQ